MGEIKFSIIVPVYNVEAYLEKCLDSLIVQTYQDYEIIAIDDGSTDQSSRILDLYQKKFPERLQVYHEENKGVSAARNKGVSYAKGEYLIFVDSDDYVKEDLLDMINQNLEPDLDILKYSFYREKESSISYDSASFQTCSGKEAFEKIIKDSLFDVVWLYAIRRKYFEGYHFKEGMYHEDFRLIPLLIRNANSVKSISYRGYYYVERIESIITTKKEFKIEKKISDNLNHYDYLIEFHKDDAIYQSFLANAILQKAKELDGELLQKYIDELRIRKVYDHVLKDTFVRKCKWIVMKINLKFYIKHFM